MVRTLAFTLLLSTVGTVANAQIIQPVNRFANAGEPEKQTNDAVNADKDDKGSILLSQASAQGVGTDKAQIALQALDLWLSRKTRFYTRLTLPLKAEPAEKPAAEGAEITAETKPSDSIVKQLTDPYGGVVNMSGGLFTRLGKGKAYQEVQVEDELRALKASRTAADASPIAKDETKALSKMQPDHGAFLDIRGGVKLIDLPTPGARAVDVGGSKLNVFYSGIAGLKAILPLYKGPDSKKEDLAGGLTLGAYIVGNYAADVTQSTIFSTALNRSTTAFTAVIGLNLPGIAGLTFSMTPWTSDDRMGKVFVFGFDVLRPTKGDSDKE